VNTDELEQLVKRCISGDRKAQGVLFNIYSAEMFGVCLYYSKDYTEAEDTLHDGFMKVFQKIDQFEFKGSLAGWIRRVMVNTSLEKFRKQHVLYAVGDDYENKEDINRENVISDLSAQDLINLIRELTPQYRMVFNLYAIEGYSHKEISEMLGISEGTSKSNLARARSVLQNKVKKYFYTSGSMKDAK
jgi:RNA polymerase sigma factor (sigma-70 family)